MRKYFILSAIIFIFLIIFFSAELLFSQSADKKFLEEKNKKLKIYLADIEKPSLERMTSILNEIIRDFKALNYSSNDKDLMTVVLKLSEEGSIKKIVENNKIINNFPEVRQKAVIILGMLSSTDPNNVKPIKDALLNILLNESDVNVKAETCRILPQIKDNDNQEAINALFYIYKDSNKTNIKITLAIANSLKEYAINYKENREFCIQILKEIQMVDPNTEVRTALDKILVSLNAK